MLGTDIRGIIAEEEEVQRRKDALKSLLSMRSKQLRESLEERIKRARSCGDWIQLSQEECAMLHKQEKLPAPDVAGNRHRWNKGELDQWIAAGRPCRQEWEARHGQANC